MDKQNSHPAHPRGAGPYYEPSITHPRFHAPSHMVCVVVGNHFPLKARFLDCSMPTATVGARPMLSRVPGTQPSTQWECSWWEVILGRLLLVISLAIPAHSVLRDHSLLNFCQVGLDWGKEHKSKDTKHSFKEYMVSLGRIVTCALTKSTDVLTATQGRVPR